MNISDTNLATLSQEQQNGGYRFALGVLTTLFFMWGFITCMNDILIPHLKSLFSLTYTQAMMIQFCFFAAYFLVSLPAGKLVHKLGHQRGIVAGLSVAGTGCLLFYPAAGLHVYGLFLGALFVLAAGITILQVAANPYVTALGKAETAPVRLTLTQGFNSLGTTVAPIIGGGVILAVAAEANDAYSKAASVQSPYLFIAGVLFVLAIIFSLLKLPKLHEDADLKVHSVVPLQEYPHLIYGAIAIFVYVGAEVAIGSFLVNFIALPEITNLPENQAAYYVAWYWGGAMVGRFIGAAVMTKVPPQRVLMVNAMTSIALIIVAIGGSGNVSLYAILAVGLCNSIMFPTIFSLAISGMGEQSSRGSGLLCLAIVGGAIIPLLQGAFADAMSLKIAFFVPILCYAYVAFYGARWSSLYTIPSQN